MPSASDRSLWVMGKSNVSASTRAGCLMERCQFQDQMGSALARAAAADIDGPFAENGRIDQRIEPEGPADLGKMGSKIQQIGMRDREDACRGMCSDTMIGNNDQHRLQVDQIAGDVKGHDLPRATAQRLVTADQPGLDQTGTACAVAFPNHVLIGSIITRLGRYGQKSLTGRRRQSQAPFQLREIFAETGDVLVGHRPPIRGSTKRLSATDILCWSVIFTSYTV